MEKHNKDKYYYEMLAKAILETFLPEIYYDLEHTDKPDLSMKKNRGIEVTRTMYRDDGQANAVFNRIANLNIHEVDHRYIETLDRINHTVLVNNEGVIFGHGPRDAVVINDKLLKEAFVRKCDKKEEYATYDALDIFIFSPIDDWFEKRNVYEFIQWAKTNYSGAFKNIIVFEWSHLYIFDTTKDQFQAIETEANKVKQCKEFALTYVQNL